MKKTLTSFLLFIIISGCASTHLSDNERTTIIQKYLTDNNITAVKRVNSFRFNGWQSIDKNQLIIESSPNKKLLITLVNACYDLDYANAIIVKQTLNSTLETRFDSIIVPGTHQFKCYIKSIHPITRKQANEILHLVKSPEKNTNSDEDKE